MPTKRRTDFKITAYSHSKRNTALASHRAMAKPQTRSRRASTRQAQAAGRGEHGRRPTQEHRAGPAGSQSRGRRKRLPPQPESSSIAKCPAPSLGGQASFQWHLASDRDPTITNGAGMTFIALQPVSCT